MKWHYSIHSVRAYGIVLMANRSANRQQWIAIVFCQVMEKAENVLNVLNVSNANASLNLFKKYTQRLIKLSINCSMSLYFAERFHNITLFRCVLIGRMVIRREIAYRGCFSLLPVDSTNFNINYNHLKRRGGWMCCEFSNNQCFTSWILWNKFFSLIDWCVPINISVVHPKRSELLAKNSFNRNLHQNHLWMPKMQMVRVVKLQFSYIYSGSMSFVQLLFRWFVCNLIQSDSKRHISLFIQLKTAMSWLIYACLMNSSWIMIEIVK